jgi:hypothetical protein
MSIIPSEVNCSISVVDRHEAQIRIFTQLLIDVGTLETDIPNRVEEVCSERYSPSKDNFIELM